MAFCAACGSNVPDGTNFCPLCGAAMASAQQPVPAEAAVPPEPDDMMKPQEPKDAIETPASILPMPGAEAHIIVPPAPAQVLFEQPVQEQPVPEQPVPAQPVPEQPVPAQSVPAQSVPAQPMPTQSVPAQSMPYATEPGAMNTPAPAWGEPRAPEPAAVPQATPPPIPQSGPPPYYGAAQPLPQAVEGVPPPKNSPYAPVGVLAYIGLMILFAIPVIGWICCIVMAFAAGNRNIRNYARAALILAIIFIIIAVAGYFMFALFIADIFDSVQSFLI